MTVSKNLPEELRKRAELVDQMDPEMATFLRRTAASYDAMERELKKMQAPVSDIASSQN